MRSAMLANGVQGIFLAAAMILGVSIMADAAPPVGQPLDPDMSRWYQSLKQPGYRRRMLRCRRL